MRWVDLGGIGRIPQAVDQILHKVGCRGGGGPPKTQTFAVSAIVTLGLLGAMACFGCGGERDQRTPSTTDSNEVTTDSNKVVADAVDRYHIAKRSGTPIDQCVQARVVTAAYLQAKDEDNYKLWKETEATDCGAVGMRPQ